MTILEEHIVPAGTAKIRLQEYAFQVFDNIPSKSSLKKLIKRGELLRDGEPAETGDWVLPGQHLKLLATTLKAPKVFRLKLNIVFEDDYFAVVQKPAGYPTNGNYFKTIEHALPFNLSKSNAIDTLSFPVAVHRLDNPTSGLLICAKTSSAKTELSRLFEERQIQKSYLAVVAGELETDGRIEHDIDEKTAMTTFERLEIVKKADKTFSIVELFPTTGRTHQLRRHLSMEGFPIIGDAEYGSTVEFKKGILLQAHSLQLKHPFTGKAMSFELPFPNKFIKFLEFSR